MWLFMWLKKPQWNFYPHVANYVRLKFLDSLWTVVIKFCDWVVQRSIPIGGPCLSCLSLFVSITVTVSHIIINYSTDLPAVLLHGVFQLVPLAESTVEEARLALVITKTSQTSIPQSDNWIRATNTTSHSVAYWNKRNVRTVSSIKTC